MFDKNDIERKIEATINSMDQYVKAEPAPYLLARIRARLAGKEQLTIWDKLTSFITRPEIIITGISLIIMMNVLIVSSDNDTGTYNIPVLEQASDGQGFSISSSTAYYDIENIGQ